MKPANIPRPPAAELPKSALRPPDFLLPHAEKAAARKRRGEPDVYVSWGGQIYGPTAIEDIMKGVRSSYFEEDAIFWFEGRNEWSPVRALPELLEETSPDLPHEARHHPAPSEAIRPSWPGSGKRGSTPQRKRRRYTNRNRKVEPKRARLDGRWIVAGAVVLAVAMTAGVLVLLSLL